MHATCRANSARPVGFTLDAARDAEAKRDTKNQKKILQIFEFRAQTRTEEDFVGRNRARTRHTLGVARHRAERVGNVGERVHGWFGV
jgi:hypothetical protein